MKCSEIRELLSLYIDNMLEESLIDEVAAHIAACPECKSEYEELIAMTRMLKELPETKLPSDFDRRLHEALSAQTPEAAAENEYQVVKVSKKKWRRKISSICAIFVVGIFVFAMYNNIDQLILGNDAERMASSKLETGMQDIYYGTYNAAGSADADEDAEDEAAIEEKSDLAKMTDSSAAESYGAAPANDMANDAQKTADESFVQNMPDVSVEETDAHDSSASGGGNHVSRGGDYTPSAAFEFKDDAVTRGAISEARDSVAIRYYLRKLEKKLCGVSFEILRCESREEGIWRFDIDLVSTDEDGNEMHDYVTYYGQDGTLWEKTETEE